MNVLVVSSYPPRHCGIGAYARDQVAELRAAGERVSVLSPPDGEGELRVPFLGGRAFLRAARIGGAYDRILIHFQPALYYRPRAPLSKVATSVSLLWLVRRRRQTEILVHEADRPIRWRPDYAILARAFRGASTLLFHTDAERRTLERHYRVRVRGGLVPHRVAPAGAPVSKAEARRRLGIEGDGAVFVCAGFLQPSKGFDRAVDAFGKARAGAVGAGEPARLYVVGSIRDETPETRAHADALRARCAGVTGAALLERYLTDEEFDLWVNAADRLVLPYRQAWSSGVLARAQALGTPSIVSATGGLAEQAGKMDVVVADDAGLARAIQDAMAPTGRPASGESRYSADAPGARDASDAAHTLKERT